jgi:predicted PurR-regulated permease PerM
MAGCRAIMSTPSAGLAKHVNATIAGFVRGQGTVCLILGMFYAIGLTIAGLNFGLLIGLFAGLISFIPYVGSMVGLVLSVGRRACPVLA